MRQYRSYNEVPENEKKMLQRADALMNDTLLHVRDGVQLWGEFVDGSGLVVVVTKRGKDGN